jgi:23S rRNA (adenine2503-C2)-methyltransferase
VRDAVGLLNAPNAHNLSRHKITVSTSGVLPRLEAVVREARTGLALSLHAVDDAERTALIPLNRVYPLAELMAELRRLAVNHGARIMIQYLLLAGRNDTPDHARRLWEWLRGWPCHVNVLEYNAVPGLAFARSSADTARRFKAELLALGARVYHRESRGGDIAGACGQLANAGMPARGGA